MQCEVWCSCFMVTRWSSLLEAVLLSFVKQVYLGAAQVHNLWAPISLQGQWMVGSDSAEVHTQMGVSTEQLVAKPFTSRSRVHHVTEMATFNSHTPSVCGSIMDCVLKISPAVTSCVSENHFYFTTDN